MKALLNWLTQLVKTNEQREKRELELRQKERREKYQAPETQWEADKLWSMELMEWISKQTDPIVLASAACLVNSWEWPEWLPGAVGKYDPQTEPHKNIYTVDVYRMLKQKADSIMPGISQKVWASGEFRKVEPVEKEIKFTTMEGLTKGMFNG